MALGGCLWPLGAGRMRKTGGKGHLFPQSPSIFSFVTASQEDLRGSWLETTFY